MATAQTPIPVKRICGLLAAGEAALAAARDLLEERFGAIEAASDIWPFTFTDYYRKEMGAEPLRQFVCFDALADPGCLADDKLAANAFEARLAERFRHVPRPVNLDPGYLTPARLVLASCKDFAHRIYLREGVYAEITLQYVDGRWRSLPWTFPDYASGLYDAFFSAARQRLCARLREEHGE